MLPFQLRKPHLWSLTSQGPQTSGSSLDLSFPSSISPVFSNCPKPSFLSLSPCLNYPPPELQTALLLLLRTPGPSNMNLPASLLPCGLSEVVLSPHQHGSSFWELELIVGHTREPSHHKGSTVRLSPSSIAHGPRRTLLCAPSNDPSILLFFSAKLLENWLPPSHYLCLLGPQQSDFCLCRARPPKRILKSDDHYS